MQAVPFPGVGMNFSVGERGKSKILTKLPVANWEPIQTHVVRHGVLESSE